MPLSQPKSVFHGSLSDDLPPGKTITRIEAERMFDFFKKCKLFRWADANNDCEDRANAVCILLDAWNIPNYKAWVFSGYFLKKENGSLTNGWNYHVAALVPVEEISEIKYYIIDPATSVTMLTIEEWANNVTDSPFSYHLIKSGTYYIFPSRKIKKDNWHKRDKRNGRWTMQGLSGINGLSSKGKAQLCFNKRKVKGTEERFRKLKEEKLYFNDTAIQVIQT
jgi:hypothetical protein